MEDFEKKYEIKKYLDRYFYVKEGYFFNKQNVQEWGILLLETLVKIFSHEVVLTEHCLKIWYYDKGYDDKDYKRALGTKRLQAKWSEDKITDLQRYGIIDAEAELIKMLSDEIAKEIDAQILKDLKGQIKHKEDFFELLKCVGVETTETMYNPMNFSPEKGFITSSYEERENARKDNVIWNYWVKNYNNK